MTTELLDNDLIPMFQNGRNKVVAGKIIKESLVQIPTGANLNDYNDEGVYLTINISNILNKLSTIANSNFRLEVKRTY